MPLFGEALKLLRLTSQPATPAANTSAMYFKSDGLPYYLGPDGIEHPFITVPSSLHLNASFDNVSGGKPTDWSDFFFTSPGVVSSDTTNVVSGAAVKLGNLGAGTDSGFYSENGTHSINDQQSISFTIWAKTDIPVVSSPILEITHITAVAQADAAILNPNAINTSASGSLSAAYKQFTFTFAVPPGHLYGRFAVRIKWSGAQSGKNVWLDESTSSATQAPPMATPVGAIMEWPAAAGVPAGYLQCNGQIASPTTAPVLNAMMGTSYGAQGAVPNRELIPQDIMPLTQAAVVASVATGWTLGTFAGRLLNGWVYIYLSFNRSGANISLGNPNHSDQTMATLTANFSPDNNVGASPVNALRMVRLSPAGDVSATAGMNDASVANANISTGDTISATFSYPISQSNTYPKIMRIIRAA